MMIDDDDDDDDGGNDDDGGGSDTIEDWFTLFREVEVYTSQVVCLRYM